MRFIISICLCVLINVAVKAQNVDYSLTNPDYYVERIPTSPEVAQLGTYGNLPVDKYTGTANVNIPIHTIDFQGISIPIDLRYNTGGIRVSQEATWVGLGWNLNTNAVISRKINGFDDLVDGGNSGGTLKSQGYIHSPDVDIDSSLPYPELLENDSIAISDSWAMGIIQDVEPDLFTVRLFNKSYSFTLSKWDGNSAFILGINHDNAELIVRYYVTEQRFEIVDANGFTYSFASKEKSDPYRSQGVPYFDNYSNLGPIKTEVIARDQVGVTAIDLNKVRNAIMSFHLDRIESPFGRELYFEYDDGLYFTYPNYSHSAPINPSGNGVSGPEVFGYEGNINSFSVNCNITLIKTKYLKRIYGDFGEVEFQLEDREDLYNWEIHDEITGFNHPNALPNASIDPMYATKQRRLSKIIVKNKLNEELKIADFFYTYFNEPMGLNIEPERHIRLKLDKVAIDDKEYIFDYYFENSLPPKDSPSVDFWGYYNGEANHENGKNHRIPSFGRYVNATVNNVGDQDKYIIYQGATRSSNFGYGKVGLLKRVYYPTKGHTDFEYEGNRAVVEIPSNAGEVHFNSTDYKYNYQYLERAEFQKQGGAEVVLGRTFTITGAETVPGDNFEITATVSCTQAGQSSGNCSVGGGTIFDYIIITNANNPSEVYGIFETNSMSWNTQSSRTSSLSLPNGSYIMSINPNINISSGGFGIVIDSAYIFDIPPSQDQLLKEYEVGGARVKTITDYNSNGAFVSKRSFDYNKYTIYNTLLSSGRLMDELIYHSKYGYFDYSPEGYSSYNINMGSSMLLGEGGNHIGYSQVTEQQLDSLNNPLGKKTCLYHNEPNEHVLRYIGNVPKYGWYHYSEGNGQGENEPTYPFVNYGFVYYLGLTTNSRSHFNGKLFWETVYNSNNRVVKETIANWSTYDIGLTDAMKVYYSGSIEAPIAHYAIYPMYQRVALLNSSVTRQFFKENTPTPEVVETVTTHQYQSKGNYGLLKHFWPTNTSVTNSKDETVSKDIVYPTESSLPYMDEMVNLNRRAVPVEVKGYSQSTFLGHKITEYDYDALSGIHNPKTIRTKKGAALEESRISLELYDAFGNLLQYRLNDGTPITYLYGYENKMYVLAKIQNAEWNTVTGILSNDEILELQNAMTLDVRMRELLDKIRTDPAMQEALVTTYTYKQGVGISSMTDSRGYTTTYAYDNSQRLEKVKDAQDKILTDTEYKYKTAIQN